MQQHTLGRSIAFVLALSSSAAAQNIVLEQVLSAPPDSHPSFGQSVALDGANGRLVVGAPSSAGGSASVFSLVSADNWQLEAQLAGTNLAREFGFDVDLEEDWIIVRAPGSIGLFVGDPFDDQGGAHVFDRSSGTWELLPGVPSNFGAAVPYQNSGCVHLRHLIVNM